MTLSPEYLRALQKVLADRDNGNITEYQLARISNEIGRIRYNERCDLLAKRDAEIDDIKYKYEDLVGENERQAVFVLQLVRDILNGSGEAYNFSLAYARVAVTDYLANAAENK